MRHEAKRQCGLVEALVVGWTLSQLQEAFLLRLQLGQVVGEVLGDQVVGKDVVSRGYRRVGGEYGPGGDRFQRRVEIEARRHMFANPLQHLESRVTLIDMPNGGHEPQGPQRTYPADPQDDLLLDARVHIPAVELIGDGAVVLSVCR